QRFCSGYPELTVAAGTCRAAGSLEFQAECSRRMKEHSFLCSKCHATVHYSWGELCVSILSVEVRLDWKTCARALHEGGKGRTRRQLSPQLVRYELDLKGHAQGGREDPTRHFTAPSYNSVTSSETQSDLQRDVSSI
ncbi:hypothetical protein BaRGS_00021782, partial [Batillaria attramentaria]